MPAIALIGYPLSHSFSKEYFEEKFRQLGLLDWQYDLFPLQEINGLAALIEKQNDLVGFNVTIPHKISMMPLCDKLSEEAATIGAVNCVKIRRTGIKVELTAYNTDAFGFEKSLTNWYKPTLNKAIIYGDGGAAKAVQYVLKKLSVDYVQLVRNVRSSNQLNWNEVNGDLFSKHDLVINCTPIGMFPNSHEYLNIEASWIKPMHHYYDLVYNPVETATMKLFEQHGASVKNGLEMLHLQADKAWEIWNGYK